MKLVQQVIRTQCVCSRLSNGVCIGVLSTLGECSLEFHLASLDTTESIYVHVQLYIGSVDVRMCSV